MKSANVVITKIREISSQTNQQRWGNTSITLFILLLSLQVLSQDSIRIVGQFPGNTKYAKVLMLKFGVGHFPVGGAMIKQDSFTLTLPPDIDPGVYRFQYAMAEINKYVDIIINGKEENIRFTLLPDDDEAFPVFTASYENNRWYEYLQMNSWQLNRIRLLYDFIYAYPNAKADVVAAAEQELEMEKALYWENFHNFKTDMQGTWAYEMVINRPFYFTSPKDDPRIQDYEKRLHFWDDFDAANPKLLNTPLYTEHILNFLRYWMNPNMNFSPEERTAGFKKSADVVIRQFSGTRETHEFAYKYLTLGFNEIGEEEVLQYLDENYQNLANQCYDDVEKSELEKRMEGYAAMKPGNKAPDFALQVQAGKSAPTLHSFSKSKTLLIFWSASCPHCLEELPRVNEWAAQHKGIDVLAVSMDVDRELYAKTINQLDALSHSCDFKGWESQPATEYYIMATPTFILLDTEKRIEAKFPSWMEVLKRIGND